MITPSTSFTVLPDRTISNCHQKMAHNAGVRMASYIVDSFSFTLYAAHNDWMDTFVIWKNLAKITIGYLGLGYISFRLVRLSIDSGNVVN